jgi:hypothetical protein
MSVSNLFENLLKIKQGFDQSTVHPRFIFDPDCPEAGQCAAAALCAQRVCSNIGYDLVIYKGVVRGRSHYINYLPHKDLFIDLTAEQFGTASFVSAELPPDFKGFSKSEIKDKKTFKRCDILYDRFNKRSNNG